MRFVVEGTFEGLRHAITLGQGPEVSIKLIWAGGHVQIIKVGITFYQYKALEEALHGGELNRVCAYCWYAECGEICMSVNDARHGTKIVLVQEAQANARF
jgi:hypothetical protein